MICVRASFPTATEELAPIDRGRIVQRRPRAIARAADAPVRVIRFCHYRLRSAREATVHGEQTFAKQKPKMRKVKSSGSERSWFIGAAAPMEVIPLPFC